MKKNNLAKIQIIVAIVLVVYVVMPDLFIGPIDDAAITVIAGIVEAVLGVMRAISDSNSGPDRMPDSNDSCGVY